MTQTKVVPIEPIEEMIMKDEDKTFYDLVREVFSGATDEECEFLLWENTAFPFCDIEHVKKQLLELKASNETT